MNLFVLVLASAVGWSGYDIARKKVSQEYGPLQALLIFCCFQSPLYLVWMLLDRGPLYHSSYLLWGSLGFVVNTLANLLFLLSVKHCALSVSIPLLSFTAIFSLICSVFLLGELPSLLQCLGCLCIIVGAFYINGGKIQHFKKKGPMAMIGAAFFWGLMASLDKIGTKTISIPAHIFYQTFATLLLLLFIAKPKTIDLKKITNDKGILLAYTLGSLSSVFAIGFQITAFQHHFVALVEAVKRGLVTLFALGSGALIFKEKISGNKILATLLIVLGVGLISS